MTTRNWPMSETEWNTMTKEIARMTGHDFMMMDVHRPITDEELEKIDPQALLDKSADPRDDADEDDTGMGVLHEEAPASRCPICFGSMPCADHANVEHIDVITSHNIDPTTVLADAHNAELSEVVVVGMKKDGTEYFASSVADAAPVIYHLQRGIHKMNKVADGDYEDENVRPRPGA